MSVLPDGLPKPVPMADGLDAPFWQGLAEERLLIQRCRACSSWQWGPEWICHRCHSDDVGYEAVEPRGVIYSYERVWHPVHPALRDGVPYVVVLVEIDHAGVRLVGNLIGRPEDDVQIGAPVRGVFEHHGSGEEAFTLLQWECVQ